jgi:nucleotide-binding universal stress UspA family protein
MTRLVLLIDGVRTHELLAELDSVCHLAESELMLLYVRGHSPRAGLELMRRRPGGLGMPPHRERGIAAAEQARAEDALDEAHRLALPLVASVRTVTREGEPGRAAVELAAREHADAIAVRVGGRDRPALGPAGLGPAARFISDHANCTVLLLRGRR